MYPVGSTRCSFRGAVVEFNRHDLSMSRDSFFPAGVSGELRRLHTQLLAYTCKRVYVLSPSQTASQTYLIDCCESWLAVAGPPGEIWAPKPPRGHIYFGQKNFKIPAAVRGSPLDFAGDSGGQPALYDLKDSSGPGLAPVVDRRDWCPMVGLVKVSGPAYLSPPVFAMLWSLE
jgi:hypothetical protein